MTLAEFTEKLDRLLDEGKDDADMVQLSGGEPTVHRDQGRRRSPVGQATCDPCHPGRGLFALPVMTVTRGINLHEIGAVIQMVRDHHPHMTTVILQPAFYAGRYETQRFLPRLTMADVAHEVSRPTDGLFRPEDFGPIPM